MDIKELKNSGLVEKMARYEKIFWQNPDVGSRPCPYGMAEIEDAEARLKRFAPYILKAFPDTAETCGIIESPLREIPEMKKSLVKMTGDFPGKLYLKWTAILRSRVQSRQEAGSMRCLNWLKR